MENGKHSLEMERRDSGQDSDPEEQVEIPSRFRRMSGRRPSFFVEEGDQIIPLKIVGADNEEILPEDIAAAPDGGWGWVIVLAAFVTSFVFGGTVFSFGVLLDAIIESSKVREAEANATSGDSGETSVKVSEIAWIGACQVSCSLFCGPFSAALVNKFGFRPIGITGSLLSSFGFAASWFFCRSGVPNILALLFFYGFIGGIGISFIFIPSIIIIGFWFEEKRALANGIAVCGAGIGTCAFPPIMSALIVQFQWQGALLAQAGMLLSLTLFALLYRELDATQNSLEKKVEESMHGSFADIKSESKDVPDSEPIKEIIPLTSQRPRSRLISQRSKCVSISEVPEKDEDDDSEASDKEEVEELHLPKPAEIRRGNFGRMQSLGDSGRRSSLIATAGALRSRRISLALPPPCLDNNASEETRILRVESKNTFNKPMNRDSIFFRGSIHQIKLSPLELSNLNTAFVKAQLETIESSIAEDDETETANEQPDGSKNVQLKEKLKKKLHVVLKMLNLGLMKSPTFIMLCSMCGMSLIGLFVPYNYLIGLAQEKGRSLEEGTSLISIIGIADTIGRIIIGIVATNVGNHVVFINNGALTIGGLATLLIPICESYTIFIIYACIFGLTNAAVASLRSIIIVELLGLAKLTNAFGLTLFCEGVATLFGSPMMGFLKDSTGTYDVTFYTAGGFMLMAGIICYPIYKVKNWEFNDEQNEQSDEKYPEV